MDKDVHNENLTLQKEASNLLASEMSEIKGGTMSSICSGSLTKPDQALESDTRWSSNYLRTALLESAFHCRGYY